MPTRNRDEQPARHLDNDHVFKALMGQITLLKAGDRLPSERKLAADLGVNRNTLRDRLQSLESFGVLDRRTGSGTYVQTIPPHTVSTVLNLGLVGTGLTMSSLQPLRIALERQAAEEAAARVDPAAMAVMASAVKLMGSTDGPHELYEADIEFHRALFDASGSAALIFFADALADVLARSVEQRRSRMMLLAHDADLMCRLHSEIYEAVLSGDGRASMEAVENHFRELDSLDLSTDSARSSGSAARGRRRPSRAAR